MVKLGFDSWEPPAFMNTNNGATLPSRLYYFNYN